MNLRYISNKLAMLIILAVMPCLIILFYSGIEQRQHYIKLAKSDVQLLTHSMAEAQKEITHATKQILSTLSQMPAIQSMDPIACSAIIKTVLKNNHTYNNIALVDLNGDVLVSGKKSTGINLADRKHVKTVLKTKEFSVGEYIVARVGPAYPSFAFACPVIDNQGQLKAILTAAINLNVFSNFYDASTLPEKSFVAITDYKGTRMFYYPIRETNPIGKPIQANSWDIAQKGEDNGLFFGAGSDGMNRIFAYEKVHLRDQDVPYLYVWAGIPEEHILKPANKVLTRNLVLLLFATLISLIITWVIGKITLVEPVKKLVALTHKFAKGELDARSDSIPLKGELGTLTMAFHEMADALKISQKTLQESEKRYKDLFNYAPAGIFEINLSKGVFVNVNQGLCEYCGYTEQEFLLMNPLDLLSESSKILFLERFNRVSLGEKIANGVEYQLIKKDGEKFWAFFNIDYIFRGKELEGVRCVAHDISEQKKAEKEKESLILKLQKALEEIKTLKGIVPICSSCKKIRDDKGYWNLLETYLEKHSDASFSHGMCPDCSEEFYGNEEWYIEMKKDKKNE